MGIRVDSHLYDGYIIPHFYDSLIAKLICWGINREESVSKMRKALDEFVIEGVKTTIPLYQKILENDSFKKGDLSTKFIDEHQIIKKMLQPAENPKPSHSC